MSEEMRMVVEISFNILYLITIWGLVIAMQRKRSHVEPQNQGVASLVLWAFGLLAFGDTGHVGFRVWAYALGGLESSLQIAGQPVGLVGVGAFMTAVTVTFFYVLMLEVWRQRFNRRYGWFEYLLLGAAALRLILMLLPVNEWNSVVPPQPWSTVRNLPLMLQGLGLAYLILRDARLVGDRTFTWIGISILVSYACYMPVIFFVQQVPIVGMLMIPKTLAYVAIGFLAYFDLYTGRQPAKTRVVSQSSV
jgi:hypothetical protein